MPNRLGRRWMARLPIRAGRTRNSVMRISRRTIFALILGAMPVAAPGFAFDGAPVAPDAAIPVVSAQPGAAAALKKAIPPSTSDTSLTAVQYAAEGGHPVAQWKLGRMYADGNGVTQDDLRAFEYFSRIANAHAEDSPSAPQAAIVANAFVALGRYYLNGIPNSKIKPDPDRAREMFSYAASYFGNADAQYDLARLYLRGTVGASREASRYRARLLRRLTIEIRPHRDMARGLFPAAHITVDPDIDQPVAGLRRHQQMIDAQAVVFLPGAGLIIPKCILAGCVGDGAQRVREPEAEQ